MAKPSNTERLNPMPHEDAVVVKKWVIVIFMAIVTQSGGAIWWAAGISEKVKAIDVIATSFDSLNSVMVTQRVEISELRKQQSNMNNNFVRRSDWISNYESSVLIHQQAQKLYDFQIQELGRRVSKVEND